MNKQYVYNNINIIYITKDTIYIDPNDILKIISEEEYLTLLIQNPNINIISYI